MYSLSLLTWLVIIALLITLVLPELISALLWLFGRCPLRWNGSIILCRSMWGDVPSLQQMLLQLNLNWSGIDAEARGLSFYGHGRCAQRCVFGGNKRFWHADKSDCGIYLCTVSSYGERAALKASFPGLAQAHLTAAAGGEGAARLRVANESLRAFW